MTDAATHTVRPPRQERTRLAWERVLEAGLTLLETGGLDAVTITDVCRLGRISPPSLYARVDGRSGLIAAIYEHGMQRIHVEEQGLMATVDAAAPLEQRLPAVIATTAQVFHRQRALMRPIVAASIQDEHIHRRGVEEAVRVQKEIVRILALPGDAGADIAAMVFAECVFRTAYGDQYTARGAETEAEFVARLTRMAHARAAGPDGTE